MKSKAKAYKVIYVLEDGRRVNNPSYRYPKERNVELEWEMVDYEDDSNELFEGRVSYNEGLSQAEYGIHWFGSKKDALGVFETFPDTVNITDIECLELWECVPPRYSLVWSEGGFERGCSYKVTLTKKLKIGKIGKDGKVTWKGVKK
jgi:hypothetical protein